MKGILRVLFWAWAFSALTGCMVGPDHQTPKPILPDRWHASRDTASPPPRRDTAVLMTWWNTFNDPQLTRLIEEARRQNLDLKIAYQRIEQARSEQNANRADLYPRISAAGAAARVSNLFPVQAPSGNAFDYFLAGFDAVWEIDVFGRLRRRLESAQAQTTAAVEDYRQAFVVLAAEIARHYVEYRGLQAAKSLTETMLGLQATKAELIGHRVKDGLSTRDELDRVQALERTTRAELNTLDATLVDARHRIELLLGKQPDSLTFTLSRDGSNPVAELRLLGQPADILRYRPDIRGAERQLASATAMQGAALAELFPKISVAAFLGLHNSDLENLFRSSAFAWASAASISQPLFNFGKIRAGISLTDARQREAFLNYQKTVLNALHECETDLTDYLKESQRRDELQHSLDHLEDAGRLAEQRFQGGLGTRKAQLDADLATQAAKMALLQSRVALSTRLIALYKALGGGGLDPVKLEDEPLRPWG